MSRTGTVALVVRLEGGTPILVDQFSDDQEIEKLERSITGGARVLEEIYHARDLRIQEEERFGDFVEGLITQPFVKTEVVEHGVEWMRSKLRIEEFQKAEREATNVIARYAFEIYSQNRKLTDFLLSGPHAQVRIRILEMPPSRMEAA